MVLSLERIIWCDFNGFLHVEIFVEEPLFPAKKLLDERWEVGGALTKKAPGFLTSAGMSYLRVLGLECVL
jgi:hypothetical protein